MERGRFGEDASAPFATCKSPPGTATRGPQRVTSELHAHSKAAHTCPIDPADLADVLADIGIVESCPTAVLPRRSE